MTAIAAAEVRALWLSFHEDIRESIARDVFPGFLAQGFAAGLTGDAEDFEARLVSALHKLLGQIAAIVETERKLLPDSRALVAAAIAEIARRCGRANHSAGFDVAALGRWLRKEDSHA